MLVLNNFLELQTPNERVSELEHADDDQLQMRASADNGDVSGRVCRRAGGNVHAPKLNRGTTVLWGKQGPLTQNRSPHASVLIQGRSTYVEGSEC